MIQRTPRARDGKSEVFYLTLDCRDGVHAACAVCHCLCHAPGHASCVPEQHSPADD